MLIMKLRSKHDLITQWPTILYFHDENKHSQNLHIARKWLVFALHL